MASKRKKAARSKKRSAKRKKAGGKKRAARASLGRKYVIKNKTYGRKFMDYTIYYKGFRRRPEKLHPEGRGFGGGKHLLETLDKRFDGQFVLILTKDADKITKSGKIHHVFVSLRSLQQFNSLVRERSRETKLDAMAYVLSRRFPTYFDRGSRAATYRRGVLASSLTDQLDPRQLSPEDTRALTRFAARVAADPGALGVDDQAMVARKRSVHLLHLRRLIAEFEARLGKKLSEHDWQRYFDEKILHFQDNYIRQVPKVNVAVVTTQFPDYGVVTADDYLDLIEIKLPSTVLLRKDSSHNTWYLSSDVSKAVAQVESYIESVSSQKHAIAAKIEESTGMKLRIMKPRGIVIAGNTSQFDGKPAKADFFRMLNEGLKNVEITPYDELARRLRNTLTSLELLAESGDE